MRIESFPLLITLIIAYLSPCMAQIKSSYGEPCNEIVRCDSKALLTCENETCLCLREEEMFFDRSQAKCVVLAGKRCRKSDLERRLDCVKNAQCDSDGYCSCDSEYFFENSEGHCESKNQHEESCEKHEECVDNFICSGGKCSCNETESVFYEERNTCVGKVGASCIKYKYCAPNAYAPDCGYGGNYDQCRCDPSVKHSRDGLCLSDYDEECDPVAAPCVDQFSCIDGTCQCHFPKYQDYGSPDGCVSDMNGPCLEMVRGKLFKYECWNTKELECRNDTGIHECLCKEGYIKSDGGRCKKAFGSSCRESKECDNVPGLSLTCREGICSCDEFQTYNETSNKCVGLAGAKCDGSQVCAKNSSCQRDRHAPESKAGICRCKSGFNVDSERRCVTGTPNNEAGRKRVETVYTSS